MRERMVKYQKAAKELKGRLERKFPRTEFSVTIDTTFPHDVEMNVNWNDEPDVDQVRGMIGRYKSLGRDEFSNTLRNRDLNIFCNRSERRRKKMEENPFEEFGGVTKELSFEEAKEIARKFDVTENVWFVSSSGLDTSGAYLSRGGLYEKYNVPITPEIIIGATGEERVRVLLSQGRRTISYGKLKNLKFVLEERRREYIW